MIGFPAKILSMGEVAQRSYGPKNVFCLRVFARRQNTSLTNRMKFIDQNSDRKVRCLGEGFDNLRVIVACSKSSDFFGNLGVFLRKKRLIQRVEEHDHRPY